jgi:hypothetical protein
VDVPASKQIRVDWRAGPSDWPSRLGWTSNAAQPDLRVLPVSADAPRGPVPTLLIGRGYEAANGSTTISDFDDTSPLLRDVNLDVVETRSVVPVLIPGALRPVLRQGRDRTWLAQDDDAPVAYVAGLPSNDNAPLSRTSRVVFFNAIRWLLPDQLPQPFSLTSPAEPTVEGTRLALHPDEGDTTQQPRDSGSLDDLHNSVSSTVREAWLPLLALASALLGLERALAFWREAAWR